MGKKRGKKQPGLTKDAPRFGTPVSRRVSHLKAEGLTTAPPILGEPSCTEGPAPPPGTVHAVGIRTGAPILGTPTLRQVHRLAVADHPDVLQTAKAPKEKTAEAGARRKIIEAHARSYWEKIPEAIGKNSKTARQIAWAVRASLPDDDRHKNQSEGQFIAWVGKNLPKN
jgi:hypothetical protein